MSMGNTRFNNIRLARKSNLSREPLINRCVEMKKLCTMGKVQVLGSKVVLVDTLALLHSQGGVLVGKYIEAEHKSQVVLQLAGQHEEKQKDKLLRLQSRIDHDASSIWSSIPKELIVPETKMKIH
jgi:hypothetical protein